jgi:hypothetical protein
MRQNSGSSRFPAEFVFVLEPKEVAALRRQFGTLKPGCGQHRRSMRKEIHGCVCLNVRINVHHHYPRISRNLKALLRR